MNIKPSEQIELYHINFNNIIKNNMRINLISYFKFYYFKLYNNILSLISF